MAFNLRNRSFLTLRDYSAGEIGFLLKLAADLKAAKYAGTEGAAELLAGRIKNGTVGAWGQMPMPANPVTDEEAKILAEWVLSLK